MPLPLKTSVFNTRTRGNNRKLKKNHLLTARDANICFIIKSLTSGINFQTMLLAISVSGFKRRLSSFIMTVGSGYFRFFNVLSLVVFNTWFYGHLLAEVVSFLGVLPTVCAVLLFSVCIVLLDKIN